ncbi:2-oxoglutarate (2OG) and Fe(II)-dependent oxygenase superfamily protein [Euphorbia peplus]|nr:2-oxoglutarate (2OG) and Fe(II)-dependent oxygenase superfamily protein [Euphorbia peplus]
MDFHENESLKLRVIYLTEQTLKIGTSEWRKACSDVRQAFEEHGCFVIEYNKFSMELRNEIFGGLKELFDLPTQVKMQNKCKLPLISYVGNISMMPIHESLGIEDAGTLQAAHDFTNRMWSNGNDPFRDSVHEYGKVVVELDQMVTRMLFESYGVEKLHDSYVESTCYVLRLLKNRVPGKGEINIGIGTHTDTSFTTILHQNQVDGLEVQTKHGNNINVPFSPTSFVVMAGDALMAWSNNRIVAPRHKVVVNGEVDRYSMGLFTFNNGIIEVPEELVDEEHPLMYRPFDHTHLLHFFAQTRTPIQAYCGI